MKILMVAIPNHHFFQWVNQLRNSGYTVYWFDITSSNAKSHRIKWVNQITNWKLKWRFPFRIKLKKRLPKLYALIEKVNEKSLHSVFEQHVLKINPDLVHCFEMKLSGLPILNVMEKNNIPFIYSSWGSDMYYFKNMNIDVSQVKTFLKRTNYLITDCKRDYQLALKYGFNNSFLGVFPGNGGLELDASFISDDEQRNIILCKGYQYDVGEAIQIIKALELLDESLLESIQIVVYSADKEIETYVNQSNRLQKLNLTIFPRHQQVSNSELLKLMGKSVLHIGNNRSDGMPNTLLEAMGMGAFPIQSNPGNATAEVVTHNSNGFLIENPLDVNGISELIKVALKDKLLREKAKNYNVNFINNNYNRSILAPKIQALYSSIINGS